MSFELMCLFVYVFFLFILYPFGTHIYKESINETSRDTYPSLAYVLDMDTLNTADDISILGTSNWELL